MLYLGYGMFCSQWKVDGANLYLCLDRKALLGKEENDKQDLDRQSNGNLIVDTDF